jgi:hypothetical protein
MFLSEYDHAHYITDYFYITINRALNPIKHIIIRDTNKLKFLVLFININTNFRSYINVFINIIINLY